MSLREQMGKGQAAKELLEHPAFKAATETLEADYTRWWRDSAPGEDEIRRQAYYRLQALDDLRRELRIALENGRMAAGALERQEA